MDEKFYTNSTYKAPITVLDRNGDPLTLTNATIKYKITRNEGGGEMLYKTDDTEDAVTLPTDDNGDVIDGEVEIEIAASDLTWFGYVWEELRVTFPSGKSDTILQRSVEFHKSSTEP